MQRTTLITLAVLFAGAARADDACKPVLAALVKYLNSPSHSYVTTTLDPKRSPEAGEAISTGSQRYLMARGKWIVNPFSTADEIVQAQQIVGRSKCRLLREESVNGEPTVVYQITRDDEDIKSDGLYYISKRNGLPVKQEMDFGPQGAPLSHMSGRIEYQNVSAPALAK